MAAPEVLINLGESLGDGGRPVLLRQDFARLAGTTDGGSLTVKEATELHRNLGVALGIIDGIRNPPTDDEEPF